MISGLPAFALYLLAVLLSPELSLIGQTWDLPLRILAATVVLLIPTTAVALCFSSMTSESRYAGFAWFSIWILGWASYAILSLFDVSSTYVPQVPQEGLVVIDGSDVATDGVEGLEGVEGLDGVELIPSDPQFVANRWILLSPYMTIGEVQKWIFGVKDTFRDVLPEAVVILVVTVVAVCVLMRRVSAPMRV
jgi:hypothetical protein